MGLNPKRWSTEAVLRANVLLFLATGTLITFWFWRNTDYFDEFGAILTFGGVLSWVAVALKIVPEDRLKTLQSAFFGRMFEQAAAVKWHVTLFAAAIVVSCAFATVQLTAHRDPGDRAVVVTPIEAASGGSSAPYWALRIDEAAFDVLPPSKDLRIIVPVFWTLRRDFIVKVAGYPDKLIQLSPWEREELVVPNSFRRPVVLLRPSERVINNARQGPWQLRVRIAKHEATVPFDGHAVWVGCDSDVQVPAVVREASTQPLDPLLRSYWDQPSALSLPGRELTPGDTLDLELISPSGQTFRPLSQPARIEQPLIRADFVPQIIDFDQPDSL
jgi:hypothetical protein